MKFFKLDFKGFAFILFAMMSIISINASAQCQAGFTWTQTTNNVITFTNTSTGTDSLTMFQWDMGDGGNDYIQNPVYTFDIPGTWYVCLTIYNVDSNQVNCISTWCDSVTVTGVVICNLVDSALINTMASCGNCADGSATCYPIGGMAPFTYLWSNGETTQNVTDLTPGTYSVCVTDANNCTACISMTMDTCSVNASFTWTQTANNTITFTNTSSGISFFTFYQWDLGDGNYDYSQSPVHFYTMPGTYYVCLYIGDSLNNGGCWSVFCDSITVTGNPCNILITPTVTNATCSNCADGAITTVTTGGTLPYTYTWNPNVSSQSSVYGLFPGTYEVCVTDSNGCSSCVFATVLDGSNNTNCSANFTLYPDSTLAHTYWAVNYATGVQPLSYTWNWGDSTFSFTAYPSHTYANAGVYTICLTITDSVQCSSTFCITDSLARTKNAMIYVNVIPQSTGIPSLQTLSNWSVYPNPVSDKMTINYYLNNSTDVAINLFDMLGNKVNEIVNNYQSSGEHQIQWTSNELSNGIYFLQIRVNDKVTTQKISIVR